MQAVKTEVEEEVKADGAAEEGGEIDIVITNVVCSFSVGCNIDMRELACTGLNVEYKRDNGVSAGGCEATLFLMGFQSFLGEPNLTSCLVLCYNLI